MKALESVIGRIVEAGIHGELWVDGSFVTERMNPSDVDFVFCPDPEFADNGVDEQQRVLDWLSDHKTDPAPGCHSHVRFEFPEGHPKHENCKILRTYWLNEFSRSSYARKGIAVIQIGRGAA